MAGKMEIQYVNFYIDGSTARQLEPKQPKKKRARLPRPVRQRRIRIYVDPLALCSIAVAVVMLVLMVAGLSQMQASYTREAELEQYVSQLQGENAGLRATYEAGYDLEEVEKLALYMGMVPAQSVEQVPITVTMPETVEEPTLWEKISTFFGELFA